MLLATVLVLALTAAAPLLGPLPSGVLSGYPLYATVLAVFGERAGFAGALVAIAIVQAISLSALTGTKRREPPHRFDTSAT